MRGEKAVPVPPKPGPDPLAVGLGQLHCLQGFAGKELKPAFPVRRREHRKLLLYFEQEHEPMTLALVPMLADNSRQMQIGGGNPESHLLSSFSASAGVRRFALFRVQFAATRAPQSQIRFLRPFQQQHLIVVIKTVEQSRDVVWHPHQRRAAAPRLRPHRFSMQ